MQQGIVVGFRPPRAIWRSSKSCKQVLAASLSPLSYDVCTDTSIVHGHPHSGGSALLPPSSSRSGCLGFAFHVTQVPDDECLTPYALRCLRRPTPALSASFWFLRADTLPKIHSLRDNVAIGVNVATGARAPATQRRTGTTAP